MGKIYEKAKEEFKAVIPPTIFFFITLHIVALVRSLMLKGFGVSAATPVSVGLMSLILGKAVLIADLLPFINRYPTKPLIYNVGWKTVLYTLVSMVLHYLEHLFDFWRQTHDIAAANQKLLAEIVWSRFLATQILLIVMIFSYCTIREFGRVIGKEKLFEMYFGIPLWPKVGVKRA